MTLHRRTLHSVLPAAALVLAPVLLTACSSDASAADPPGPTDGGTVILPTSAPPTTDSSGNRIMPLPTDLPDVRVSEQRVRGMAYGYPLPAGWHVGDRDLEPRPDTIVEPDDSGEHALVAVERPFAVGDRDLRSVVSELRRRFEEKGYAPQAAPERDVAGYHAQGIVIDQSDDVRHVYYVVVYAGQAYAIRLTYDPHQPHALAVLRTVLDAWSWG
jgi:hypothetical protein